MLPLIESWGFSVLVICPNSVRDRHRESGAHLLSKYLPRLLVFVILSVDWQISDKEWLCK